MSFIWVIPWLAIGPYSAAAEPTAEQLVEAALDRTNQRVTYDPAYQSLDYPGGDVAADRGVCTDVIIRSYRTLGIDLQKLVHEDMTGSFAEYPDFWGLNRPDPNIDHRRVPNLRVFLERHGTEMAITESASSYKPGDLVTWNLKETGSLPHIGIVTDKTDRAGVPFIVHNIGAGPKLENMLFDYKITGHYRFLPNEN